MKTRRRVKLNQGEYASPTTVATLNLVSNTMKVLETEVPNTVGKSFDVVNNVLDGLINVTEVYKIPKTQEQLKLEAEELELETQVEIEELKLRIKELQNKEVS